MKTSTVRVGVIGYGYWGPNLARNFAEIPGAELVAVCDLDADRLTRAELRHPGIDVTTDAQALISRPDIDAVAIATPVSTHFPLAHAALLSGKHVLVEKPLAASADDAARLIDEAARRRLVLLVDHTFVYTGAIRAIQQCLADEGVGEVLYYDSVRINLGLFQHDVNVIWDLAVHDLAILDYLLPQRPVAVSATGMRHVAGGPENIAYVTLYFDGTLIAHVHVNWLAPVKVRQTLIGGTRRMIVYNDLEPLERVRIYEKGIVVTGDPESVRRMRIDYRTGDMWAPKIDATEALRTEALHFVECVTGGMRPITDGEAGLRVVRILEAATASVAGRGRPVALSAASVVA
jgi:predicted dehydrogenase